MAETIKIGGELESMATGNVVAAASAIKDKVKNKYQGEINAEVDETLTNHSSAINGLNSQNYVTVTATDQTTSETDVLPATGSVDTVYRVGNWDGSQFDASVYSEYAWNGSSYVHLNTKTQVGEVFDISAYHATGGVLAKYADLQAALGTGGANIPESLRKGGMSVKFVQSSDHKYVQYRYMGTEITGTPNPFLYTANWQGVDDEPIAGSDNLVKSGGVDSFLKVKANINKIINLELTDYPSKQKGISKQGNLYKWENFNVGYYCKIIPVNPATDKECRLTVTDGCVGQYTFLRTFTETVNVNADLSASVNSTINISNAGVYNVRVPNDSNYLYIRYDSTGTNKIENVSVIKKVNDSSPKKAEIADIENNLVYPKTEIFKDFEVLTTSFPENNKSVSFGKFSAGKYRVALEGSATKSINVSDTWASWLNINIYDTNNVNIGRIYNLQPSQIFAEGTFIFECSQEFELRTYGYFDGSIIFKLSKVINATDYLLERSSSLCIEKNDIYTPDSNVAVAWESGVCVDKETLSVIPNTNYSTTSYIPISTGGIYNVGRGVDEKIGSMKILFFNSNHEGVYFEDDEITIGNNGNEYITHTRISNYVILRQSVVEAYGIKYMKVSIPYSNATYFGVFRFTNSYIASVDAIQFEKLSNNHKIIKMSWFNRSNTYTDSQIIADMYKLASFGATLYFDDGDISLDEPINTIPDNLGKSISLIFDDGVKIRKTSNFPNNTYMLTYIQSYQLKNINEYDGNGNLLEVKPVIRNGIFECDGTSGGLHATYSRGLLLENILVHNANSFAIKLSTSPRSGYENLVNKCRLIYDLHQSIDNVGIGGSAGDSSINELVVIGYHKAVTLSEPSNVIYGVHGWIGWNFEEQWENSQFIESNGTVIACYADTYHYGFKMAFGSVGFSRTHANHAFASIAPINDINVNVSQFGNSWLLP